MGKGSVKTTKKVKPVNRYYFELAVPLGVTNGDLRELYSRWLRTRANRKQTTLSQPNIVWKAVVSGVTTMPFSAAKRTETSLAYFLSQEVAKLASKRNKQVKK